MATVTKNANANTVVTTGWTNAANAYSDDTSYATAAPGKSTSITSDFGFPAFTTSDIPDGATITNVTASIRNWSSTTGSTGAVIGFQLNNNGTLLGSETTEGMTTSERTSTKAATSGVSVADLRTAGNFKVRCRGYRSTSNTAITWSIDWITLDVTYVNALTGDGSITPASSTTGDAKTALLASSQSTSAVSFTSATPTAALIGSGSIAGVSGITGDAVAASPPMTGSISATSSVNATSAVLALRSQSSSVASTSSVSGNATVALLSGSQSLVCGSSVTASSSTLALRASGQIQAVSQINNTGAENYSCTGAIVCASVVSGSAQASIPSGSQSIICASVVASTEPRVALLGPGSISATTTILGDAVVFTVAAPVDYFADGDITATATITATPSITYSPAAVFLITPQYGGISFVRFDRHLTTPGITNTLTRPRHGARSYVIAGAELNALLNPA